MVFYASLIATLLISIGHLSTKPLRTVHAWYWSCSTVSLQISGPFRKKNCRSGEEFSSERQEYCYCPPCLKAKLHCSEIPHSLAMESELRELFRLWSTRTWKGPAQRVPTNKSDSLESRHLISFNLWGYIIVLRINRFDHQPDRAASQLSRVSLQEKIWERASYYFCVRKDHRTIHFKNFLLFQTWSIRAVLISNNIYPVQVLWANLKKNNPEFSPNNL